MSNLRKYWREHVFGHFGVAALSGYLSWQNPAAGLLFAGQCVRQVAGYWQKRDTVSIDLAWCVAGFATGLVIDLSHFEMNVDMINLVLNGGCAGMLFYLCLKVLDKFRHH